MENTLAVDAFDFAEAIQAGIQVRKAAGAPWRRAFEFDIHTGLTLVPAAILTEVLCNEIDARGRFPDCNATGANRKAELLLAECVGSSIVATQKRAFVFGGKVEAVCFLGRLDTAGTTWIREGARVIKAVGVDSNEVSTAEFAGAQRHVVDACRLLVAACAARIDPAFACTA